MFREISPSDAFTEHGAPLTQLEGKFYVAEDEPEILYWFYKYRFNVESSLSVFVRYLWMEFNELTERYNLTMSDCAIFTNHDGNMENLGIADKSKHLVAEMLELAKKMEGDGD